MPLPLCSENESTWDESCTPPSSWDWGEFEVGRRSYEKPRLTEQVLDFYGACVSWNAPCDWIMGLMKWPLDYLGAHPICVVDNEYAERVRIFIRTGSTIGAAQNQHGWHNCSSVIDPMVIQPPDDRGNDVGYRLSDTGLSLADRCRAVLPEDVVLETRYGNTLSDGTARPPTRFEPGHAGCDDWAEYVEGRIELRLSYMPDCVRSARLAQEWMEHHYGVHERYYGFHC